MQNVTTTSRDANDAFSLGRWDVYPHENRLVDADQVVALEPRVMSLLVCLARTPGTIVSNNELLDQVWDGRAHGDQAVYQAIGDLRRALGDAARTPRYIETIPKRGYRLIARVGDLRRQKNAGQAIGRNTWRKGRWSVAVVAAVFLVASWATLKTNSERSMPVPKAIDNDAQIRAYDHYQVGMRYLSRRSGVGQGSIAAAEFRRAIAIDPDYAPAYAGLAEVLYRQNLLSNVRSGLSRAESAVAIPEEVDALLERALELAPGLADVVVLMGRIAQDRDDLQQAELQYRAALQNAPNHVRARQGFASVLRAQGRYSEARQQLEKALALEPRNPALLFDVMHVLDDSGEYDELMRFAEHAVKTDPDSASIFLWLNRYYLALGRPDQSIALLAPIVGDPRFTTEQPMILSALSGSFLIMGDIETAELYDEQARLHSDSLLYTSMWTLLVKNRSEDFIDSVHTAVATTCGYPGYLAYLESLAGHNQHALAILEMAMAQPFWNPDDTDVLIAGWQPAVTAALVLQASGQMQPARGMLQEIRPVLEEATADPRRRSGAYYFLAAIESIEGNPDASLAYLQQAAESGWSLHWLIDYDPAFANIRLAPEYRRIVDSVRERMELLRQTVSPLRTVSR